MLQSSKLSSRFKKAAKHEIKLPANFSFAPKKAEPVIESNYVPNNNVQENNIQNIQNINYKMNVENQNSYTPFSIKKVRKNNLYGDFDNSRPSLRDYN